ncbi:MAG: serine/threonine protein kinase [Candidatus Melainabacteria bacterium]|nr:serine/threonine protein kinase [Candidatus Melainabacteria bacterium]
MMPGRVRRYGRALGVEPGVRAQVRPGFFQIKIPSNFRDMLVGQWISGIGKYYVLRTLGTGGMSVVYAAKHLESHKIYAVKTLRMQAASDELTVKRFQREAETLTYLNHPNIVRIHDYGKTSKKQPFFIMDFLTGDSLNDVLKREKLISYERVQTIFMQVLAAVAHAHKTGLVHRDLKPGNIMLLKTRQQSDFVKVVDFGIAKFEEEAQKLTRMGEVWGSPIYMSPEQCMGGQLDQRADIYSLGIVMYEALTGEVPFFGKNYVETMSKQIGEPAKPPSQMNPNVKIPEKLERLIMRSLEKEPNKRYQRVEEMLDDLHKSVEVQKKKAQPAPSPPKQPPPAPPKQPSFEPSVKPKTMPKARDFAEVTMQDYQTNQPFQPHAQAPNAAAPNMPPAAAQTSGEWQSFDPEHMRNQDMRSARRSQDNMPASLRKESVEISREYTRDSMRTSHTRARAYGTGDPRVSGSRYSRIRYEEKPTFTGLVVKSLLIALFLGLSFGVVTMALRYYSTVNGTNSTLPVVKVDESDLKTDIKGDLKQTGEKGAEGSKR